MRIDIHNYEAFFLDHVEGNLDAEQEKELFAFLEEYPQLKAELESFEPVTLEADVVGLDKNLFKKNDPNEEMLIGYVENVIDEKSRREVENLAVQNVALAKELRMYESALLEADLKIKFPHKNKLKRGGVVIYLQSNPTYLRVAAALLLLVGLFFLVSKLNTKDGATESKPILAVEGGKKGVKGSGINDKSVTPQPEGKSVAVNAKEKKQQMTQGKNSVVPQFMAKREPNVQKDQAPVISNTVSINTHTVLANNEAPRKEERDSVVVAQVMPENKTTYQSYYNYSADDDDAEPVQAKQEITASANTGKKTLFQRLTNAAKKVNDLGVKKVDGEEQNGTRSLSIGGFVLSETVSH